MFDVRDVTVCFALATVYMQRRDERVYVNRQGGTGDDSDGGDDGVGVAVETSDNRKRNDQGDAY